MGDLIRLAERREPAVEAPPLVYQCKRCGGREFTLHAAGMAYCVNCRALIRNLLVISVAC